MRLSSVFIFSVPQKRLHEFCDGGTQGFLVGTLDLLDLLAALVELEGWHGSDAALGGDGVSLVDIDLDEFNGRELFAHLLEDWADESAWSAPDCVDPREQMK